MYGKGCIVFVLYVLYFYFLADLSMVYSDVFAIACIIFLLSLYSCINDKNPQKEIVLRLEPSSDNPRNSEGDFIRLKDGSILFIYTHFTGGSGDHATANLAGRISNDDGQTWSDKYIHILYN